MIRWRISQQTQDDPLALKPIAEVGSFAALSAAVRLLQVCGFVRLQVQQLPDPIDYHPVDLTVFPY